MVTSNKAKKILMFFVIILFSFSVIINVSAEPDLFYPVNLIPNGNFNGNTSGWTLHHSTMTISGNDLIVKGDGTNYKPEIISTNYITIYQGHEYYIRFNYKMIIDNINCTAIGASLYGTDIVNGNFLNNIYSYYANPQPDIYGSYVFIDDIMVLKNTVGNGACKLYFNNTYSSSNNAGLDNAYVTNESAIEIDYGIMLIDLTATFGVDIPTIEECRVLFDTYFEGELVEGILLPEVQYATPLIMLILEVMITPVNMLKGIRLTSYISLFDVLIGFGIIFVVTRMIFHSTKKEE